MYAAHPDVDVHVVQIDGRLSREGGLLPGLGDAGNRLFGAPSQHSVKELEAEIKCSDKYDWEEAGDQKKRPMKAPTSPTSKRARHALDEPSTRALY